MITLKTKSYDADGSPKTFKITQEEYELWKQFEQLWSSAPKYFETVDEMRDIVEQSNKIAKVLRTKYNWCKWDFRTKWYV